MKSSFRFVMPVLLFWTLGVVSFPDPVRFVPVAGAHECPRGSTAVEDFATGKIICERRDRLDTESIGGKKADSGTPGTPGAPGRPGAPGTPKAPESPKQVTSKDPNCGLSRWGCEQACQKTYLSTATGSSPQAAQRAKVALAACIRICTEEFSCPAEAPKTP